MSAAHHRIRSMRVDAGLSQGAVARAVGKSQGWLSLIESGYTTPDDEELQAIKSAILAAIRNRANQFNKMLAGVPA